MCLNQHRVRDASSPQAERRPLSALTPDSPPGQQANIKHGSVLELYKHELNQTHENDVVKMKREIDRLKVECEKLRAELK